MFNKLALFMLTAEFCYCDGLQIKAVDLDTGKEITGLKLNAFKMADVSIIRNNGKMIVTPSNQKPYTMPLKEIGAGIYSIDEVPSGKFMVCTDATEIHYVNPCKWNPILTTESGKSIIWRAKKAVAVEIVIKEEGSGPISERFAEATGIPGAVLAIRTQDGAFMSMDTFQVFAGRLAAKILVPASTSLNLWFFSQDYQINDVERRVSSIPGSGEFVGFTSPASDFDSQTKFDLRIRIALPQSKNVQP